ncbi:hypothetical protein WMY93_007607 [Mugilogobius chulae]|uniref:Ig-like domain-containing protein n=1 Tax=Mugilogobius chulae TaxID=88201 RepID=A0AAW0PPL7_9GOBI
MTSINDGCGPSAGKSIRLHHLPRRGELRKERGGDESYAPASLHGLTTPTHSGEALFYQPVAPMNLHYLDKRFIMALRHLCSEREIAFVMELHWVDCCHSALQVQIIPTQGEISLGDSKFFICEVVGDAKDIDWYNPQGEKILPDNPNIFVSRNDEATSTLTIYHATVDNAGIYKCMAKAPGQEAEATVQVKIFQKITFQNAPSPQEFNEGDDADLVCDVVSSPPLRSCGIQVQRHQERQRWKADEGMYSCEARVIARGELDFKPIKVIINVLPTIRPRQTEVNSTAEEGSTALLACDADGFPEPSVSWAQEVSQGKFPGQMENRLEAWRNCLSTGLGTSQNTPG